MQDSGAERPAPTRRSSPLLGVARGVLGPDGVSEAFANLPQLDTGRRVLVVVDDPAMAELLAEALGEAGHQVETVDGLLAARSAVDRAAFDAALVDLDTRARNGAEIVALIRCQAPAATVIAFTPCGGLRPNDEAHYHLALEKPARLRAVLAAVAASHKVVPP
jgi:DNA-binding response OmpR family regulator